MPAVLIGAAGTTSQAATLTFTSGAAVPAGATVVVAINIGSNSAGTDISSISDGTANVYTKLDNVAQGNPTDGTCVFYCQNCLAVNSGVTWTLNISGPVSGYGATFQACYIQNATSSPLDQHGTSTTMTSPSKTTTSGNETIIGFASGYKNAGGPPTFTDDAAFTTLDNRSENANNKITSLLSYRDVSSTGSYSYAPTSNFTNDQQACFISTWVFNAASSGFDMSAQNMMCLP